MRLTTNTWRFSHGGSKVRVRWFPIIYLFHFQTRDIAQARCCPRNAAARSTAATVRALSTPRVPSETMIDPGTGAPLSCCSARATGNCAKSMRSRHSHLSCLSPSASQLNASSAFNAAATMSDGDAIVAGSEIGVSVSGVNHDFMTVKLDPTDEELAALGVEGKCSSLSSHYLSKNPLTRYLVFVALLWNPRCFLDPAAFPTFNS